MSSSSARREFLKQAALIGSGAVATSVARRAHADTQEPAAGAERRLVVGVMGMQRGMALAKAFARQDNVEVRYVCDVDQTRLQAAAGTMQSELQHDSQAVTDFRQILDDPSVDILVCAAPKHWHGPATILGCKAGKHVYVEKPASHTPAEGELMTEAAQRHQRLVQVGMQRRSNSAWQEAIEQLNTGLIGDVYYARSWYSNLRGSIGQDAFVEAPDYLNYELWQGPAPRKPYSTAVVHYNWHWRWHWGNGEVGNNGVHTLDLCRWGLGVDFPTATSSIGGRYAHDDVQETPDTNTASFTFDGNKSATWECTSCNRHRHGFVTFYGTDGTLELDDDGGRRHYDRHDKLVTEYEGSPHSLRDHVANFLSCIREEKPASSLNANIEIGHRSALLCHLANISYRVKRILKSNRDSGHLLDDPVAAQLWDRNYDPDWVPTV